MKKKLLKNTFEISNILKIISNQERLAILCLIDKGEKNVGYLQDNIEAAQSTISNHLKVLKDHGFVSSKRTGRIVEYKIIDKRVLKIMKELKRVFL